MSDTKPKKMIFRNIAIALGIICIGLGISLVELSANYTSIINSKDSTINAKDSDITSLQQQINSLNRNESMLTYDLYTPYLIIPDLKVVDNRTLLGSPYLEISGHMCNFAMNTTNAGLHVWAYQGASLTFNTTTSVREIQGRYYEYIDQKISYFGNALTLWEISCTPHGYAYYGPPT